jgi:hypothetical protein
MKRKERKYVMRRKLFLLPAALLLASASAPQPPLNLQVGGPVIGTMGYTQRQTGIHEITLIAYGFEGTLDGLLLTGDFVDGQLTNAHICANANRKDKAATCEKLSEYSGVKTPIIQALQKSGPDLLLKAYIATNAALRAKAFAGEPASDNNAVIRKVDTT